MYSTEILFVYHLFGPLVFIELFDQCFDCVEWFTPSDGSVKGCASVRDTIIQKYWLLTDYKFDYFDVSCFTCDHQWCPFCLSFCMHQFWKFLLDVFHAHVKTFLASYVEHIDFLSIQIYLFFLFIWLFLFHFAFIECLLHQVRISLHLIEQL